MDKTGQSLTSSLCIWSPFPILQLLKSLWLGLLSNYIWKATQIISDSPPSCIQIHSQINASTRHDLSFWKPYGVFIYHYMHTCVPAKARFILWNSFYQHVWHRSRACWSSYCQIWKGISKRRHPVVTSGCFGTKCSCAAQLVGQLFHLWA